MKVALILLGLVEVTQQATASPLKNTNWPLYPTPAYAATYTASKELTFVSATNTFLGGYQCIRQGNVYSPSQSIQTSPSKAVIAAGTIQTFYTTATTKLGLLSSNNFDCCPKDLQTGTNCAGVVSGTAWLANKIYIYRGGANSDLTTQPSGTATDYTWKDDFILASQF